MIKISEILTELEKLGEDNDSKAESRSRKLLNITKDTGEFLSVMVSVLDAERVLEVGTSNGYSTIWLASSMSDSGRVTTLEIQDHKIAMAEENFRRAGLADKINIINTDAASFFRGNDMQYDMVFLDAERVEYMSFADDAVRAVKKGGLLICDNAVSHEDEMSEFIEYISSSGKFRVCTLPVGKGEFVACRLK